MKIGWEDQDNEIWKSALFFKGYRCGVLHMLTPLLDNIDSGFLFRRFSSVELHRTHAFRFDFQTQRGIKLSFNEVHRPICIPTQPCCSLFFKQMCFMDYLRTMSLINLLIDFNGISICLGLFYVLTLGNSVYCMFIFTFVSLFSKNFCSVIRYQVFLSNSNILLTTVWFLVIISI